MRSTAYPGGRPGRGPFTVTHDDNLILEEHFIDATAQPDYVAPLRET